LDGGGEWRQELVCKEIIGTHAALLRRWIHRRLL